MKDGLKALLWKERRQNRGIFSLTFLVIGTVPLFDVILRWVNYTILPPGNSTEVAYGWLADLLYMGVNSIVQTMGVFWALILGVIILAQERLYKTMDFLAATPVSRKDIVKAKYLAGLGYIAAALSIDTVFIAVIHIVLPSKFGFSDILLWYLSSLSVLALTFSISFFIATITGNWISSTVGAMAAFFAPAFIKDAFINGLLMGLDPGFTGIRRIGTQVMDALILPNHIATIGVGTVRWLGLRILLSLLAAFLLYLLSIFIYRKNSLEKNGQILMFCRTSTLLTIVVPLFIAFVIALFLVRLFYAELPVFMAIYLIAYALSVLLLLFFKRHRSLGLKL